MKKAVIFDLDGTLLNTLPDIAAAMNRALAHHGLPTHPERAYRLFTGNGARILTQRALGEGRTADMEEQVYHRYAEDYAANSLVDTAPYPDIPQMLRALTEHGIPVCVFSNKDDTDVQPVVRHFFADQQLAVVRGARPGVALKPDPAAPLAIAASLGLTPADFMYVGDTQTDMRCAKNAGMDSVAVTWGFQTREEIAPGQPGQYADSAEELLAILLRA